MLSVIIISLVGCQNNQSKEKKIIGEWDACWETKAGDGIQEIAHDNLKMNGTINFKDNGEVEISAFGFKGCIFSDDTLKNILNWKIDDTVLRFIDGNDELGLPYNINKFTNQELHLTLLDDINLTLSRN